MSIPGQDLRWFSDFVRQIYAHRTLPALKQGIADGLQTKLRLILASCDVFSLDFAQFSRDAAASDTPELYLPAEVMFAGMADCPTLLRASQGDRSPLIGLWDTGREVENTEFYNLLVRPFGVGDQRLMMFWGRDRVTAFSVARDTPLSATEQTLIELLHSHIAAALARLEAADSIPLPAFGDPWVPITEDGFPRLLSLAQQRTLRDYFPEWKAQPRRWPSAVHDWLRATKRYLAAPPPGNSPRALLVDAARGRFIARFFPGRTMGDDAVRIGEVPARMNFRAFGRRAGLSPRESEIAHWLVAGKRDTEIAAILCLATPSVSWHVYHILRKLRVGSRAAVLGALLTQP